MLGHGINPLWGFEAVARTLLRERAHQAVARHLGDDRGPPAIDMMRAVAADSRPSHSQGVASRSRPVDEDMFAAFQAVPGRRSAQRPERRAQDIVAIDPRRRRGDHGDGRTSRRSFSNKSLALARRSGAWKSSIPLGDPLGIEHDGPAATTGPANGPRPALVAAGHRPRRRA